MKVQPIISIITPFYNAELYLEECIVSILQQSFKEWELILINDFSTDASNAIAERYAQLEPRIRLFQNTRKGLIPALQLAEKQIKGEYLTRMDADDLMPLDKLENLLKTLQKWGKNHVAVGNVKYFSDEILGEGYQFYENWLNDLTNQSDNYSQIYRECVIPSPNFLILREDFNRIGGFQSNVYPEDYDLAFRMYQNGIQIASCEAITHFWRDHPTRSTRTQEHYQMLSFIPLKIKYFALIDHDTTKELILWGAAKKGKLIARELQKLDIPFTWVTENKQRIGHNVYGVIIKDAKALDINNSQQYLLAVSNKQEQEEIKNRLRAKSLESATGWFLFF